MKSTRTRTTAVVIAGLLALGACGGDDDADSDATPPTDGATNTTADATDPGDSDGGDGSNAEGNASLMLDLIGGPDEGTHRATALTAGCSRNGTGDGTFGVQYTGDDDSGFHSYQIVIDDADAAATGNSEFVATARVDENQYHLARGEGMLTLEDRGDTARITILGTTGDGVDVSAVVDCHTVLDF